MEDSRFAATVILSVVVAFAAGLGSGVVLADSPVEVKTVTLERSDDDGRETSQVGVDIIHRGSNVLLEFSTSFTATCQVVYGTDGYTGAVGCSEPDRVMDHTASLTGLSVGETYQYRIVFIDSDGGIHVTDEKSFTAEPVGDTEDGGNTTTETTTGDDTTDNTSSPGDQFAGGQQDDTQQQQDDDEQVKKTTSDDGTSVTYVYEDKQDITGFGIQTSGGEGSSGQMTFDILVEGEEFGPFDVPDDEQLYTFELETIGQDFTVEEVSSDGDVSVETFELYE